MYQNSTYGGLFISGDLFISGKLFISGNMQAYRWCSLSAPKYKEKKEQILKYSISPLLLFNLKWQNS